MVKYGFTGSQYGTTENIIKTTINGLNLKDTDSVITGACIGVDSQISHYVKQHYPNVHQIIIVPWNLKKVDKTVYNNGEVIFMLPDTTYRDRNIAIVEHSDILIALWNGRKAYSGTFMTINIARKKGMAVKTVMINE